MIEEKIAVPDGAKATVSGETIEISGPNGTLRRSFGFTGVTLAVDGNHITVKSMRDRKKEKAAVGTIRAHIRNMIKGVTEGFCYKLKVVYSHFPITIKKEGKKVLIHNFMGERSPRVAEVAGDCNVEVKGDEIIVSGTNKEDVAQTSLRIEHAARVTGRDRRVFQDGCYIVERR